MRGEHNPVIAWPALPFFIPIVVTKGKPGASTVSEPPVLSRVNFTDAPGVMTAPAFSNESLTNIVFFVFVFFWKAKGTDHKNKMEKVRTWLDSPFTSSSH